MMAFAGWGRRLSDDPYWFNALTGQVVHTDGDHHSAVFTADPGILDLNPDDVRFKCSGEAFAMAYASEILARGWCRIDIIGPRPSRFSYAEAEPGSIFIFAPSVEAANAALWQASTLTPVAPDRLIVMVSPMATKDTRLHSTAVLERGDLQRAFAVGLDEWFRATPAGSENASKSKMQSGRGCPFGRAS